MRCLDKSHAYVQYSRLTDASKSKCDDIRDHNDERKTRIGGTWREQERREKEAGIVLV